MTSDLLRPMKIASTKYDGSPHYEFDAILVAREGSMLRLYVEQGTTLVGYRGELEVRTPFAALFWTDRPYNVYHNKSPLGRRRIVSYANVGTPATIDGDVLRWVDLDLDVFTSEGGGITLDDVDEFEQHQVKFAYPAELIADALATSEELLALAKSGAFPFDRDAHIDIDVPPAR
jgi:protein associated with RNAse G/E